MATFEKIAFTEVGSGGATDITFSVIPSTFTDLCVKYSFRSTDNTAIDVRLQFNGSTANIYSERMIYSSGSGSGASAATTGTYTNWTGVTDNNSQTASTFSNNNLYIPNYAGSNNKGYMVEGVQENNATLAYMYIMTGLWASTAQISIIKLFPDYGNLAQYSTATLYGIKKA
jgi:hypothetical protein